MNRRLGPIRQNGYVVKDLQATMDYWITKHGVGPWFVFNHIETDWFQYKGSDSDPDMTIALANSGDLQLELIQQHNDAPSLYKDFLDAGFEGLQHVSYWTTEFKALHEGLIKDGFTMGHEGQIGGDQGRFCYFDWDGPPGSVVEISDISGPKGEFFSHIRNAALEWDGANAIQVIS